MIHQQRQKAKSFLIVAACEGLITVKQAALRLGFSERWVKALKARYRKMGEKAFVHGNTGRTPPNKIPERDRTKIVEIKQTDVYLKANFKHYTEILAEMGIKYSYTSVTNILKEAGCRSPKTRRKKKASKAHPLRPRRESFGEMLQADSSPYDWFGTGEKTALHGYIDDATGCVTGLYFCKNECLLGYLEVTRQTVERYGVPAELYPDKASVFFLSKKDAGKLTIEEQLEGITERKTQLGGIMDALGVHMHPAHTPQAKGRIERLWETLQSRLPIEFRRRGIRTMEAANRYLPAFIKEYNKQFAVRPAKNWAAFIPLYDKTQLDRLLAAKAERVCDGNGVFSFHNYKFLAPGECRGKKITLLMNYRIGMKAALSDTGPLYGIQPCAQQSPARSKTHMPDVTKALIAEYLTAPAKETARPPMFQKRDAWAG
jgi:transposase